MIELPEVMTVHALSEISDVPAGRLIGEGVNQLARLLTIHETLRFEEAQKILKQFHIEAQRKHRS